MRHNPQAFARPGHGDDSVFNNEPQEGMTLLDYFAGQALIALIIGSGLEVEKRSERAYEIAKSMLSEREKHL